MLGRLIYKHLAPLEPGLVAGEAALGPAAPWVVGHFEFLVAVTSKRSTN
jgi:hypothetical protein